MHKICNQGGHEACTRMGKIEEGNNKLEANGGFFAVRVFKKRSEDELKPDLRLDNIRVGIRTQPNVSKAVGGVAKGQEKAASNIPCLCLRSPKQGEPEGSFGVIRVVVATREPKRGPIATLHLGILPSPAFCPLSSPPLPTSSSSFLPPPLCLRIILRHRLQYFSLYLRIDTIHHSPSPLISSLGTIMPADEHHIAVPQPQATSSHMMKTTKRGRPFLKVCCVGAACDV